ncbi:unnamed protein product [Cuscuta epithymum]|uniref:Uncharacterized protein n=1 Tax=Cuscuta epithymum TaxID=186058 RepID=A0AAV0DM48_9ASTE|nr:unnamed protein product [Cuscuta epithymum]CAH9139919.1 unnamed protein product [Cuscuta epithymum]
MLQLSIHTKYIAVMHSHDREDKLHQNNHFHNSQCNNSVLFYCFQPKLNFFHKEGVSIVSTQSQVCLCVKLQHDSKIVIPNCNLHALRIDEHMEIHLKKFHRNCNSKIKQQLVFFTSAYLHSARH